MDSALTPMSFATHSSLIRLIKLAKEHECEVTICEYDNIGHRKDYRCNSKDVYITPFHSANVLNPHVIFSPHGSFDLSGDITLSQPGSATFGFHSRVKNQIEIDSDAKNIMLILYPKKDNLVFNRKFEEIYEDFNMIYFRLCIPEHDVSRIVPVEENSTDSSVERMFFDCMGIVSPDEYYVFVHNSTHGTRRVVGEYKLKQGDELYIMKTDSIKDTLASNRVPDRVKSQFVF